ncbi:MAG: hypothetical protein CMF22_10090 [Idiomarinaceae bacterium]|nr:hypothetical protein [Idiomarinaceae bacterium]MBG23791.1 hypothetical protein [Idiomarinaceae bacterium]|tara:strand:+ start:52758 stop:53051 length:294 start_codon:yes stop_codon:yes gene_type:complete
MSLLYVTGQSSYTSSAIGPIGKRASTDYYPPSIKFLVWGDFGGGDVKIEVRMPDDSWVSFPDLTFTGNTAQEISLFNGAVVRVVVTDTTSVNVFVDN